MIAIAIIGMYLDDMKEGPAYELLLGLHKASGVVVLMAAFVRFFYRMLCGFPQSASAVAMPAAHAKLARSIHWLLLLSALIMPSSGVIGSITGGYPIDVFGFFVIPAPESANETLSSLACIVHGLFANLLMMALLRHVNGALKHQFNDKDATLSRMFGRRTVQRRLVSLTIRAWHCPNSTGALRPPE